MCEFQFVDISSDGSHDLCPPFSVRNLPQWGWEGEGGELLPGGLNACCWDELLQQL